MEVIKQGVILKVTKEEWEALDRAYDVLYNLKIFGEEYEKEEKETFNHLGVSLEDIYEACDTLETIYRHFKDNSLSIVVI